MLVHTKAHGLGAGIGDDLLLTLGRFYRLARVPFVQGDIVSDIQALIHAIEQARQGNWRCGCRGAPLQEQGWRKEQGEQGHTHGEGPKR
ncbi:hypothetical protein D3C72_2255980 [compost metagenome]